MDKLNMDIENMSLVDRIEADAPRIGPQGNAEQKLRKAMYDTGLVAREYAKDKRYARDLIMGYKLKRDKLVTEQIEPLKKTLETLGVDTSRYDRPNRENIDLIEVAEMEFPRLRSGAPWAILWSLAAGLGLLYWWFQMAMTAIGQTLKIPDRAEISKMLEWTSAKVGLDSNEIIGCAIVTASLLIVMFVVYAIVKSIRAFSNLKKAKAIEKDTQKYLSEKNRERAETTKLKTHVEDLDKLTSKIKVLLVELKSKIDRAVYIENISSREELHRNSQEDVRNAEHLLAEASKLLSVVVARGGVVSNESLSALESAKKSVDEFVDGIYGVFRSESHVSTKPVTAPFKDAEESLDDGECEEL